MSKPFKMDSYLTLREKRQAGNCIRPAKKQSSAVLQNESLGLSKKQLKPGQSLARWLSSVPYRAWLDLNIQQKYLVT